MPVWSQPQDLKECLIQGLSFRGMVLALAVLAILISEVRFNWVEILVGRYLAATNHHRPESGNVWEQGRLRKVATQTLEQMVTRQLTAQREAQDATSLVQLLDGLSAAQGSMISADQFKKLYTQIPASMARNLFSPILMLRISAEKSWDRVYLERENGQVGIYLLDRSNNVLSYAIVNDQQLRATDAHQSVRSGTLDEQVEFVGRIYPADRFFMVLDTLPPETQQGVLAQPDAILTAGGTPLRVGVSNEVNDDSIRIGIEMDTSQGRQVLSAMAQEWAIWQVRMLLEPNLAEPPAGGKRWSHSGGDR